MTTERINHRAHDHANTVAARTACRKSMAKFRTEIAEAVVIAHQTQTTECTIDGAHCEQCGSTDYEDINLGDQGYTACCNELISRLPGDCRNHHA